LDNKVFDIIDARCNHEVNRYMHLKHTTGTDEDQKDLQYLMGKKLML